MTISVTVFKARCLELLRRVEERSEPIEITRRGKVIARITPAGWASGAQPKPWERMRGSGRLLATAEESVLSESDFTALQ